MLSCFVAFSFFVMFATPRPAWGVHILTATFFIGLFRFQPRLSAICVAYGALFAGTFGGLSVLYVTKIRWALILAGGAIFVLRFSALAGKAERREVTLFQRLMQCFVIAAILSAFVSDSPTVSATKLVPLVALVVVCSLASLRIVEKSGSHAARLLVASWLIMLAPTYLFNVLSVFTGGFWVTGASWSVGSFRGIAGNSNALGAFLAVTLPYFVAIVASERHRMTGKMQALALLTVALCGMLFYTRSRASALAFLVAALVINFVHPKNRMRKFAVLVVPAALCYLAINPALAVDIYENWIYKGKTERGLLSSRIVHWEESYLVFQKEPWLGVGFGVTSQKEEDWTLKDARAQKVERGSSLLAVLSQVGLIGGIPFYLGIGFVLFRAFGFACRVKDPYFTAVLASCLGAFANSFFEGWLVSPGNGLLWLFLMQMYLMDAVMSRFRPPSTGPSHPRQGFAPGMVNFAPVVPRHF